MNTYKYEHIQIQKLTNMKRFYFFISLIFALGAASHLYAQSAIESITVLDWDGSQLNDRTLYIGVGEQKELQLAVQPEGADLSTISLGMEMLDGDEELGSPASFNGLVIYGNREGTRHLFIYNENRQKQLASVSIVVSYVATGRLYPEETQEGQVWYSLNAKGQLQFWADSLDNPKPEESQVTYNIPNYESGADAPWYEFREDIKEVILYNLDNIGNYAFNDLTNVHFITFPENIQNLGEYVFVGSENLRTMQVERYSMFSQPRITTPAGVSLVIENSDPQNPRRPEVVIVNNDEKGALEAYQSDEEWSQCGRIVQSGDYVNGTVRYEITPSETTGGLQLTISQSSWADDNGMLADRTNDITYPWDDLGDLVEDLRINDRIRYIGADVFSTLANLQTIQFMQSTAPLDSINVWAFSRDIRPWKFAFGDPQDGPVFPPKIVGANLSTEEENTQEALDTWSHFHENTVLYVPDSAFMHNNELVRSIDLYRDDPIWGQVFNRITDHTVESNSIDENEVILKWLPEENAISYRLTIRREDCADCEAVLEIPATGRQGLVDWDKIPVNGISRRVVKEDEHGGMTLTINIQPGSGMTHNADVEVSITGMEANMIYLFTRDVSKDGGIDAAMSKSGSFSKEADAIENIYDTHIGETRIFDILGRAAGNSVEALPDGIYIMCEGDSRIKFILRR